MIVIHFETPAYHRYFLFMLFIPILAMAVSQIVLVRKQETAEWHRQDNEDVNRQADLVFHPQVDVVFRQDKGYC